MKRKIAVDWTRSQGVALGRVYALYGALGSITSTTLHIYTHTHTLNYFGLCEKELEFLSSLIYKAEF